MAARLDPHRRHTKAASHTFACADSSTRRAHSSSWTRRIESFCSIAETADHCKRGRSATDRRITLRKTWQISLRWLRTNIHVSPFEQAPEFPRGIPVFSLASTFLRRTVCADTKRGSNAHPCPSLHAPKHDVSARGTDHTVPAVCKNYDAPSGAGAYR